MKIIKAIQNKLMVNGWAVDFSFDLKNFKPLRYNFRTKNRMNLYAPGWISKSVTYYSDHVVFTSHFEKFKVQSNTEDERLELRYQIDSEIEFKEGVLIRVDILMIGPYDVGLFYRNKLKHYENMDYYFESENWSIWENEDYDMYFGKHESITFFRIVPPGTWRKEMRLENVYQLPKYLRN